MGTSQYISPVLARFDQRRRLGGQKGGGRQDGGRMDGEGCREGNPMQAGLGRGVESRSGH